MSHDQCTRTITQQRLSRLPKLVGARSNIDVGNVGHYESSANLVSCCATSAHSRAMSTVQTNHCKTFVDRNLPVDAGPISTALPYGNRTDGSLLSKQGFRRSGRIHYRQKEDLALVELEASVEDTTSRTQYDTTPKRFSATVNLSNPKCAEISNIRAEVSELRDCYVELSRVVATQARQIQNLVALSQDRNSCTTCSHALDVSRS